MIAKDFALIELLNSVYSQLSDNDPDTSRDYIKQFWLLSSANSSCLPTPIQGMANLLEASITSKKI